MRSSAALSLFSGSHWLLYESRGFSEQLQNVEYSLSYLLLLPRLGTFFLLAVAQAQKSARPYLAIYLVATGMDIDPGLNLTQVLRMHRTDIYMTWFNRGSSLQTIHYCWISTDFSDRPSQTDISSDVGSRAHYWPLWSLGRIAGSSIGY